MLLGPFTLVVLWTIVGIDTVYNTFRLDNDATLTLFFVGLFSPFVTIGLPFLLEKYRPMEIALTITLIATSLPFFGYTIEQLNLSSKAENIKNRMTYVGSNPQGFSLYRDDRPAVPANQRRTGYAPEPTYRWVKSSDRIQATPSSHAVDPDNEMRVLQARLADVESESYIGIILICAICALTSGLILLVKKRKADPASHR